MSQLFDESKPYVIVCEGNDDYSFLDSYLHFLSDADFVSYSSYQIIKANGVKNMTHSKIALYKKIPNYEYVISFLFVRDADTDANGAVASMRDNISRVWGIRLGKTGEIQKSPEGLNVGFFIFPGLDENGKYRSGMLEDLCSEILCLTSTDAETISNLVDVHMEKVENETHVKFKNPHKNRMHLIFNSTNKLVGSKIPEVVKKHVFDFSSVKMEILKERIISMQNR